MLAQAVGWQRSYRCWVYRNVSTTFCRDSGLLNSFWYFPCRLSQISCIRAAFRLLSPITRPRFPFRRLTTNAVLFSPLRSLVTGAVSRSRSFSYSGFPSINLFPFAVFESFLTSAVARFRFGCRVSTLHAFEEFFTMFGVIVAIIRPLFITVLGGVASIIRAPDFGVLERHSKFYPLRPAQSMEAV